MPSITKNVSATVLTVSACNAENVLLTINGDGRQPDFAIRDDVDRYGYYSGLYRALCAKRDRLEKDPETVPANLTLVKCMIKDVREYLNTLEVKVETTDQKLRFTAWFSIYGQLKRDNGKLDPCETVCNSARLALAPVLRIVHDHYDKKEASKNEIAKVINSALGLSDENKVPRKVCVRVLSSIYRGMEVDKKTLKVKEKFNDLNAVKEISLLYASEILPVLENPAK